MAHTWSEQQEAIFDWFENSHPDRCRNLIVRARAGTGKTTVIIEGVKRAPEGSILLCAFSKIIQQELEARIGKDHGNIRAQTLHSVGYACVRRYRENIRVSFNNDRADALAESVCGAFVPDAIKRLVSKLHTKGREIAPHACKPGDLTAIAVQFDCVPDEEWAASGFDLEKVEELALKAMELAAQVKSGETIDGSDMIFLPVRNHWLTGMYDLVVVDEAQDMTTAQLEIAQGVLRKGGRIAIVGDDRQAIFGFRGADSNSLDRLKTELDAGELGLTITYRCGQRIVDMARELVPDYQAGPNNPMGSIEEMPLSSITAMAGPGDYILSRVNAPLVSIAMRLLRQGKRTRIAGRDIGKGLITLVRKMKGRSVPHFLERVGIWEKRELTRLEGMLLQATNGKVTTIKNKMVDIQDQAEMLLSLSEGARSVSEIENRIESLFADDGLGVAGMITCSSVHRAKGLEANRVFVLQDTLRDWNQEELNIQYVAITRAKQILMLVTGNYNEE